MHEADCAAANRPHVACMNHGATTPEPAIGASEAEFPYWFGGFDDRLGIVRRCVIYADGQAWLSDGRCAFLMRQNELKTKTVKDMADVIRLSIRGATVNVQEGHIMFEPDTPPNQLGYGARNFVIRFGGRILRGLDVALARRLYGDLSWAMNPDDVRAPIVAFAAGHPVGIIMPNI